MKIWRKSKAKIHNTVDCSILEINVKNIELSNLPSIGWAETREIPQMNKDTQNLFMIKIDDY